jgi:hypothetical protein
MASGGPGDGHGKIISVAREPNRLKKVLFRKSVPSRLGRAPLGLAAFFLHVRDWPENSANEAVARTGLSHIRPELPQPPHHTPRHLRVD